MNEVFADSFYWIALLNPSDAFHETARSTPVSGQIVTSLAVQLEVLDAFSAQTSLRPLAVHFWECTNRDPQVTVIPLDAVLMENAMALFKNREDKAWSFTDCISFEIMRDRKIVKALSGDHHFWQAGFQAVFSSSNT